MNLVDSCGWLEYFAGAPNSDFFASPIEEGNDTLLVPTLCLYEVFKRVLAQRGEEDALQAIGIMSLGTIVDLTQGIALAAAIISQDLKIAMADSIILATARAYEATLWTQDADFEGMEQVHYIAKK